MSKVFGIMSAVHLTKDGVQEGWIDPTWSETEFCDSKNEAVIFDGWTEDIWFHSDLMDALEGYIRDEEAPHKWDYFPNDEWIYTITLQEKVYDSQHGWIVRDWTYEKPKHLHYPHHYGRLISCHGCEAKCYCTGEDGDTECVFCSINGLD